jgi:hypothetical protein
MPHDGDSPHSGGRRLGGRSFSGGAGFQGDAPTQPTRHARGYSGATSAAANNSTAAPAAPPLDALLVGTVSHLQAYAVDRNADLFFKDVPDGVSSLVCR